MKAKLASVGAVILTAITLTFTLNPAFAAETKQLGESFLKWLQIADTNMKHDTDPSKVIAEHLDFYKQVAQGPGPKKMADAPFDGAPWWFEGIEYYDPDNTLGRASISEKSLDGKYTLPMSASELLALNMARFNIRARENDANMLHAFGILGADTDYGGRIKWGDIYGLSSEKYQDVLWEWAQPALKVWWAKSAPNGRHIVRAHTIPALKKYLAQFDLAAELAWLNKVGQLAFNPKAFNVPEEFFDDERLFYEMGPDGKRRALGKIEAFVVRRISHGDITKERFIALVERVASAVEEWDKAASINPAADEKDYLSRGGIKLAGSTQPTSNAN